MRKVVFAVLLQISFLTQMGSALERQPNADYHARRASLGGENQRRRPFCSLRRTRPRARTHLRIPSGQTILLPFRMDRTRRSSADVARGRGQRRRTGTALHGDPLPARAQLRSGKVDWTEARPRESAGQQNHRIRSRRSNGQACATNWSACCRSPVPPSIPTCLPPARPPTPSSPGLAEPRQCISLCECRSRISGHCLASLRTYKDEREIELHPQRHECLNRRASGGHADDEARRHANARFPR